MDQVSSLSSSGKSRTLIPFSKPTLTRNELKSVLETLLHDGVENGQSVLEYEKEFAHALEYRKALAVTSLTSAYHLAFLSAGLDAESEIILPASAPIQALDAIGQTGAKIKLIDFAKDSFHPSVDAYTNAITENTRVVFLFYPFGSFKDYTQLRETLRSQKQITVVEDISYIIGSEFQRRFVGADADIAIAGLHSDMMMTIGKGAMLMSDSKNLFATMKDLRMHGGSRPYRVRYDYAITDYQAAMGLEQLGLLNTVLERRKKIGQIYLDAMKQSQLSTFFFSPDSDAFGLFPVVFHGSMENAKRYFKSVGIETRDLYPQEPLHKILELPSSEYPNAQRLHERSLLLPLYPYLTKMNVERITTSLKGFF